MNEQHWKGIVLLMLLAACCIANQDTIDSSLVNTKVERVIDLTTHLAKFTTTITLTNKGSSGVNSFLYVVDPQHRDNVAYIGAWLKDQEEDKLDVAETTVANQIGKQFWRVQLPNKLNAGKSMTVVVEALFSHLLQPYPTQITQAEKQYVRFSGNLVFFSPYKTDTQTTKVTVATSTIESYTKTKPVSATDNAISYGPFESREPFSESELQIHSENNSPFLTVTKLKRTIEISHWGNIAVEEVLDIMHTGAKLKGSFSRYDYQRSQDGLSSIKSFKTVLPSSARDVYYRDEIGNISTSSMRSLVDSVEVELRPRFPLFGGWKTHYFIGYNVPSYEYLFNKGDQYVLQMRVIDHIYDDMLVDELQLKIILPEGSKDLVFKPPFELRREKDQSHYTYLDTIGRPVLVATKNRLVEAHIQDFELHYTFHKLMLLQEPMLVIGAFYLLFFIVIIYVRMDFSITKDEASESRMRVASLIEQIQSTHDKRSALYQSYSDAINKFKSSKDGSSFQTQRKKIELDHKSLSQQIAGMQAKLKQENTEIADKVAQVQKLDNQFRDQVNLTVTYAEKLVAGKMGKPQYLDYEATNDAKKDEIIQKMEDLLASL